MKKTIAILAAAVVCVTTGFLVYRSPAENGPAAHSGAGLPPGEGLPPHVIYRYMFHHIASLEQQAQDAESRGEDGSRFRLLYNHLAQLSDAQAQELKNIALDLEKQIAQQDQKAKGIIDGFRAQHPSGKIEKGEILPPPPPELKELQDGRNAMVLEARDRLNKAFGDETFNRFDRFVGQTIGPNITTLRPNLIRPPAARQPGVLPSGAHSGSKGMSHR